MLSRVSPSVPLHFQVVSRASLWEGSWETPDRERKTRELPGAGEPEPPWGLCPLHEDGGWQRREQRWQIQSDTRHDPLPGRKSRESVGPGALETSPLSLGVLQIIPLIKLTPLTASKFQQGLFLLGWLAPVKGLLARIMLCCAQGASWMDSIKVGVIG